MSDEDFLKRWSRRKQEARATSEAAQPVPSAGDAKDVSVANPPEPAPDGEIDLSKLPPIDSITAATDITEFLRKGIPAELSRAALRRAWTADPAIRDFIGLAENAWDFTDPNAIPGFGPLQETPEQVAAMVERIVGGVRDTAEKLVSELPENEQEQQKSDQELDVSAAAEELPHATGGTAPLPEGRSETAAAVQPEESNEESNDVPVRRHTHGGAMPT
jgi:hypothetical protein